MAGTSAEIIRLPAPRLDGAVSVERSLAARKSVRSFRKEPLELAALSQLLWAAQGVTRPMDAPPGWSWGPWQGGKRTAPSAGATYPLDIFVIAGDVKGVKTGVYRYVPLEHHLVRVREGDRRKEVALAASGQQWITDAPCVLVVGAVLRRTEMKYGSRAERYVQIEAGHAVMNLCLQAVALELGTTVVGAFQDAAVKRVAGMPEEAAPLLIVPVGRGSD